MQTLNNTAFLRQPDISECLTSVGQAWRQNYHHNPLSPSCNLYKSLSRLLDKLRIHTKLCVNPPHNPLVCHTHYLMAWARSTHFHCSTGWPFSCRRVSNCCRPAWSAGPPARVKRQSEFRWLHTLECTTCCPGLQFLHFFSMLVLLVLEAQNDQITVQMTE